MAIVAFLTGLVLDQAAELDADAPEGTWVKKTGEKVGGSWVKNAGSDPIRVGDAVVSAAEVDRQREQALRANATREEEHQKLVADLRHDAEVMRGRLDIAQRVSHEARRKLQAEELNTHELSTAFNAAQDRNAELEAQFKDLVHARDVERKELETRAEEAETRAAKVHEGELAELRRKLAVAESNASEALIAFHSAQNRAMEMETRAEEAEGECGHQEMVAETLRREVAAVRQEVAALHQEARANTARLAEAVARAGTLQGQLDRGLDGQFKRMVEELAVAREGNALAAARNAKLDLEISALKAEVRRERFSRLGWEEAANGVVESWALYQRDVRSHVAKLRWKAQDRQRRTWQRLQSLATHPTVEWQRELRTEGPDGVDEAKIEAFDPSMNLWVHRLEQLDRPVPAGWYVCHQNYITSDRSGSRRVAVGSTAGAALSLGRKNANLYPMPHHVPPRMEGYPKNAEHDPDDPFCDCTQRCQF
jgi:chromosome segregation ATPase